jgi:hypothetical protein
VNWGKVAILAIVLAAVGTGAGIWYAQEYGFYDEIDPTGPGAQLGAATETGQMPLVIRDFQGIDASSSPIRWRACARLDALPEGLIPFEGATPLVGPNWFDCFDAERIGSDLESGAAQAFLGQSEIHPDVDRVLAIYPDGRIYGWHQYNDKTPERGVMD